MLSLVFWWTVICQSVYLKQSLLHCRTFRVPTPFRWTLNSYVIGCCCFWGKWCSTDSPWSCPSLWRGSPHSSWGCSQYSWGTVSPLPPSPSLLKPANRRPFHARRISCAGADKPAQVILRPRLSYRDLSKGWTECLCLSVGQSQPKGLWRFARRWGYLQMQHKLAMNL